MFDGERPDICFVLTLIDLTYFENTKTQYTKNIAFQSKPSSYACRNIERLQFLEYTLSVHVCTLDLYERMEGGIFPVWKVVKYLTILPNYNLELRVLEIYVFLVLSEKLVTKTCH